MLSMTAKPNSPGSQRKRRIRSVPRDNPVTRAFLLRLYPDEYTIIDAAAALDERSMSAYIARVACQGAKAELIRNGINPEELLSRSKKETQKK
jgi:hypothetical protein